MPLIRISIKVNNFRISVHPAFWAVAVLTVLQKRYVEFLAALVAVLIHELAHAKAAYERGYVMDRITLMPYGAVLKGGENIAPADQLVIAAAGPGANAAICLMLYALWWRFPATYVYTKPLFETSFAIGAFNLLPFYPLDGARIILALSKKPVRALKTLRIAGIAASMILFLGFIISAFFEINYTIGIMAVLLYLGAAGGTEKEMYRHLYESISDTKLKNHPMELKTVTVHWELKLISCFKRIRPDCLTEFVIVDDDFGTVKKISEKQLLELMAGASHQSTLKEVLSSSP